MFAIAGRRSASRAASSVQKRFAHGVHYAPAQSLTQPLRWLAGISVIVGVVTYDRFYSDRAITKLVTPKESDAAEIARQRERFADRQITDQDRNITLLQPLHRSTATETFSPRPVPEGAYRAAHTGYVIEPETLGERRPRTEALAKN